ncbi:hypothetical protein B0T21DRAFT_279083 [Apiosordaria backusii]|uniref:Uncharacterized protein n=1 Tax=Apiosordaria backusii TaxID=314023 RepID=A0AA40EXX2_9PEZI|nr:hypothetical protein B0T21DRAFT_279083 [Apiosordaria backusii]
MTLPIVLGVCIPLVGAIGVLIYLHRRNVKRSRLEDMHDPHKSLDFGLGADFAKKNGGGGGVSNSNDPSRFNRQKRQQMSMDMNLSSPYLLPDVGQSRDSLNSLARTLKANDDPYSRSDAGSIRSFAHKNGDAVSVYTRAASRSASRQDGPLSPPQTRSPPRLGSMVPNSPLFPPSPSHMRPPQSPLPEPPNTTGAAIGTANSQGWDEQNIGVATDVPVLQQPPNAAQRDARKSPLSHTLKTSDSSLDLAPPVNPFEKPEAQEIDTPTEPTSVGLGLMDHGEPAQASVRTSTSTVNSELESKAQRGQPAQAPALIEPERAEFHDFDFTDMPRMPRSPSPEGRKEQQLDVDEPRGRNMQRTSHLYEQQQEGPASGLGVPMGDNRRLSVGFRPLPPDEITESEDPEYRANRIRSFYKEYFEDSAADRPPMPPMPQIPAQHQQKRPGPQQNGGYYDEYAADAPYFDPASNSFIMPYAQPVSRRAMTPPPSGQRFPGPRGPGPRGPGPRGPPGPPGLRGPPRPGSSVSNQIGGPSRPGSGMSSAYGRPRAGSTMSGGRFGGNGGSRTPVPPPMDLNTLPTPAMLKDDSFMIINAADFAPPENFASRARGRSQSPAGERRAYERKVPVHSPLVNAYDELAALPSPHTLRKSSTFTGLDFAPPRKFANDDARSDAGSIRSNRSGLSNLHANALRNGAGRVSKLPGDQIFTPDALAQTLKPTWGLRDKM